MSFLRTVLGDLPAAEAGRCYAHEHLIIDRSYPSDQNPDFLLDSVEKAAEDLREFRAAGGKTLVDSMPCDCGRNVLKMAALAEAAQVHIVIPTGVHLAKYYPSGHWSGFYDEAECAELFAADVEEGIDAGDYSGPIVKRTPHRAGVIKVASGGSRLDEREKKLFRAAAAAHRRTGCPILTHTEQGEAGLEQIAIFREAGADLGHVVLSHTDRKPDPDYHREILRTGVNLEYDSAFRWKEGNPTRDLLVELLPEFPGQLMLGMDAARRSYWHAYGGAPGMAYLLETFVPELKAAGVDPVLIDGMFLVNPARAYGFAGPRTGG